MEISKISNCMIPEGVLTGAISPFFLPRRPLPIGEETASLPSPDMAYSPPYKVTPKWNCSCDCDPDLIQDSALPWYISLGHSTTLAVESRSCRWQSQHTKSHEHLLLHRIPRVPDSRLCPWPQAKARGGSLPFLQTHFDSILSFSFSKPNRP
jgi:hypothetical protein